MGNPQYPVVQDQDLVAKVAALDEDAREFFEERAGIRQYEGGLSRQEAEAQAYEDVRRWQRKTT